MNSLQEQQQEKNTPKERIKLTIQLYSHKGLSSTKNKSFFHKLNREAQKVILEQ